MRIAREEFRRLLSDSVAVRSTPFRLGSNHWDIQFTVAPDALCSIEGSNDKMSWLLLSDAFGNAIDALGQVMRVGLSAPKWLRFVVAADGSPSRGFTSIIAVQKQGSGG